MYAFGVLMRLGLGRVFVSLVMLSKANIDGFFNSPLDIHLVGLPHPFLPQIKLQIPVLQPA